jgi:tRNA/rRNA methyltransferase
MSPSQREARVRFVLVRPRDPNNIGAAARAMANFGFRDMAVVEPYPPVWREARSAVGAGDLLRRAQASSLEESLAGATLVLGTCGGVRRLDRPVVPLPSLREFLKTKGGAPGGRVAVLFGNEKTGLSREQIGHCHALVRIPTVPELPSMNLGQAVALVAYELARRPGAREPRLPGLPAAPAEQTEALRREFLRAFAALGYQRGVPEAVQARRVRDALNRLRPCRQDAGLLLAVLRRVGAGA